MFLVRRFYHQFPASVRHNGHRYYQQRRVKLVSCSDSSVRATVIGSRPYNLSIEKTPASLNVFCTCPYFWDGNLCKHLWASFLAADSRGFLKGDTTPYLELIQRRPQGGAQSEAALPLDPEAIELARKRAEEAEIALWKKKLAAMNGPQSATPFAHRSGSAKPTQIVYLIDVAQTLNSQGLALEIGRREMKADGQWGKPKAYQTRDVHISTITNRDDKEILGLLSGSREGYYGLYSNRDQVATRYRLLSPMAETLVPKICRTGRCVLRRQAPNEDVPLKWDNRAPWEFWVDVRRDESSSSYIITGSLRRGDDRKPLGEPVLLIEGGLVFWDDRVARLDDDEAFTWISQLRTNGVISVPFKHRSRLIEELLEQRRLPRLDLPPELHFSQEHGVPKPLLKVLSPDSEYREFGAPASELRAQLFFKYETEAALFGSNRRGVFDAAANCFILRDSALEEELVSRLWAAGFKEVDSRFLLKDAGRQFRLNPRRFARAVKELVDDGWQVEAEGKLYRSAGSFKIDVTSGIDWFELHGGIQFGETTATLPQLLAAARAGENTVLLGDGTFGLLPEDWLKKYGLIAAFGTVDGDHLRFHRGQAGLLDALLASQPDATFDETFAVARAQLREFQGIEAADPPAGFTGELRAYQREGLGWMNFLSRFGFGGCLADCMGLGKTVMALALLESRREIRASHRSGAANGNGRPTSSKRKKSSKNNGAAGPPPPSLLVVPKSLVFNWKQEAARFTPGLRVLDHTGMDRVKDSFDHFANHDLVITTYGTLRRDAAEFNDTEFDYVILDESQAVKNADTESAKAVRLLKGKHKLALSGTPIENHLGELWSLFDFLNPGLLGSASVFRHLTAARRPDDESRTLLAKALRPFILRRTKEQVAKDLPDRLEQTIYCEMEPAQRQLYDELRQYYRATIAGLIERRGIKQSKIQILEALLRLRQAACHPALIDKKRSEESSAKLEVLALQLNDLLEEGHKILVFSQFTSFLSIIRDRLDRANVLYEYLDGKTRDRQARVERFQQDPDCKLFLISLKAGGLGLNLTAAEYVFLLDPWWNPAVEAQAIDRAHRIGQTRQVFAYRLIARGTVEEKVLQLQETKRNLADAIISADNSLIRNLTSQDLDLLFS